MKLDELLQFLSHTTLNGIYVGRGANNSYVIPTELKASLYKNINIALNKIYAEFPLMTKDIVIRLKENRTMYYLTSEYAELNTNSAIPAEHRYIEETPLNPFKEDVIQIQTIKNSQGKVQYQNNSAMITDIRVVADKIIQVPMPTEGELLFITYSAYHEKIDVNVDPTTFNIVLNDYYLSALCAYIGYLEYKDLTNGTSLTKAQQYYKEYLDECNKITDLNINNISYTSTNTVFDDRGYV